MSVGCLQAETSLFVGPVEEIGGIVRFVPNPDLLIATDRSTAISRRDGRVFAFTADQQARLRDIIDRESSVLDPVDISLVRDSVLLLPDLAAKVRDDLASTVLNQWRSGGLLVVMPTERCNFRCTYCYETFMKGGMPNDIVEGVVSYIERVVPQFKSFDLAWFGGEPLLQLRTIERISRVFRDVQKRCGTRGTISITTNGYGLTDKAISILANLHVDVYQITVDGPKEIHDRQRLHINGSGTYDRIFGNIERLFNHDDQSKIVLRVNIDTSSAVVGTTVRRWLVDEINPRFKMYGSRFEVHVVPIWAADTTAIDGICLTDVTRYQVWSSVLEAAVEGGNLRDYLAAAVSKLGGLACYAGRPHSYVVGADGTVYKCTVALDLPQNQIGSIRSDGELIINPDRERVWTSQNLLTDPVCGNCAFSQSCQGIFCPLLRLQTDRQPCPTEKRFADAMLGVPGGDL